MRCDLDDVDNSLCGALQPLDTGLLDGVWKVVLVNFLNCSVVKADDRCMHIQV